MILNNDAAKTIPFLREKFDNHSLCTFRNNLAWLECQYGSGVWNISSHTSLKCNQHNPIWKELLQTDGKTTDLYCRSVFPLISLGVFFGFEISLNQRVSQHYWYFTPGTSLKIHKLTRWIRKELQRVPVFEELLKTCEKFENDRITKTKQ